jgi:uncharacterized protein with HEPN domain
MQRKLDVLLWDIEKPIALILRLTQGKSLENYETDELLRLSVERVFITLGENLVRLRKSLPEDYRRLTEAAYVVDFRNQMVHQYELISDRSVWKLVTETLPRMRNKAAEMFKERQP